MTIQGDRNRERVRAAIESFEKGGRPLTMDALAHACGLCVQTTKTHWLALGGAATIKVEDKNRELVRDAIENLEKSGRTVTITALARACGLHTTTVKSHWQALSGDKARLPHEATALANRNREKIRAAIEDFQRSGRALGVSAVARACGLRPVTVKRHWESVTGKDMDFSARRLEASRKAVREAIGAVVASGGRLTQSAVVRSARTTFSSVRKHWNGITGAAPPDTMSDIYLENRQAVVDAVAAFRKERARVTQLAVALHCGLSPSVVGRHWEFANGGVLDPDRSNVRLFEKNRQAVRDAVEEMRAAGEPVINIAIVRRTGLTIATVGRHLDAILPRG